MDAKWYRQTKYIVAALALAAGSLGMAAYAFSAILDGNASTGTSNQCDLPLAQRTGGWFCPGP